MNIRGSRSATLLVAPIFIVLLGTMLYLQDAEPQGELKSLEGPIVNRTPIKSKGNLTGFRFCIGEDRVTFTYSDPDPRVAHAWDVINNSKRARVHYSTRPGWNPALWGLEADGEILATTSELREARGLRYLLYAIGFVVSTVIFVRAVMNTMKLRKLHAKNLRGDA